MMFPFVQKINDLCISEWFNNKKIKKQIKKDLCCIRAKSIIIFWNNIVRYGYFIIYCALIDRT